MKTRWVQHASGRICSRFASQREAWQYGLDLRHGAPSENLDVSLHLRTAPGLEGCASPSSNFSFTVHFIASHLKKPSTIQRHRGARSFFFRLVAQKGYPFKLRNFLFFVSHRRNMSGSKKMFVVTERCISGDRKKRPRRASLFRLHGAYHAALERKIH